MDMQSTLGTAGFAFKNILKSVTDEMQMCIQNCSLCSQACEQTIQHCLSMGGPHSAPSHIRLLMDCAAVCDLSAHLMIGDSRFHARQCGVCAEVCDACALECESLEAGDEAMRTCAEVCRRCAESCRQMALSH